MAVQNSRMQNPECQDSCGDDLRDESALILRNRAWTQIINAICPTFQGKFFAFGDSCVAAVHYQDFFEGMEDCSFAALRGDYEEALPEIEAKCQAEGLVFQKFAGEPGRFALHARVGLRQGSQPTVWVNLYPLDNIPNQITLRFKMFKEARKLMYVSSESEVEGAYSVLHRYNSLDLDTCSCFCGGELQKNKAKRTVFQRTVSKKSLFPLRECKLGSCSVPVAREVSNWTVEMTTERKEAISIVQEESLKSLHDLDRVCQQLNIDYFLVGGSMLGAVRHQGFIPWDDDTDVGLLRSDYKRFCKESEDLLGERYFIQTQKKEKHFNLLYARLRRSGIDYISNYNENKQFNKGIWVDLFPFDAIPKNKKLAEMQRKAATYFARKAMKFKRRREYVIHDVKDPSPIATREDKFYLKLFNVILHLIPCGLLNKFYQLIIRFFNPFLSKRKDAVFACYMPSYTTIARDEIYPVKRIKYEQEHLNIPNGSESFLMRQYGDYSSYPPLHKRFCEHGFKRLIINKSQSE